MSQTFEDYSRKLQKEANANALQAEAHSRLVHLQAFNFSRSPGRRRMPATPFGFAFAEYC